MAFNTIQQMKWVNSMKIYLILQSQGVILSNQCMDITHCFYSCTMNATELAGVDNWSRYVSFYENVANILFYFISFHIRQTVTINRNINLIYSNLDCIMQYSIVCKNLKTFTRIAEILLKLALNNRSIKQFVLCKLKL